MNKQLQILQWYLTFRLSFAVARIVTVPDLCIWKTTGIEHFMNPVTLRKTHSELYSDPAKLSKGGMVTNLLKNEEGTAP